MNRLPEYISHHPFLIAAVAILVVLAIVIEIRERAKGSSMIAPGDAVRLVNGGALVLDVRGFASASAAKALRALGFSKVATLRGGLRSWRQENLPLVKGGAKKDGKPA